MAETKTTKLRTGAGRRIYAQLRAQINDGTLAPDACLPSTRALALELGVSRTTVTAAYEQLAAEGFVTTAAGKAARVAPAQPAPSASAEPNRQPDTPRQLRLSRIGARIDTMGAMAVAPAAPVPYDFLYGAVAPRDYPVLAWRRAYQKALLQQQPSLYYSPPEGDPALVAALQGYLRRARGLNCTTEQILVVHGSQQGMDLCARLLLDAHDSFAIEDPSYLIARRCFEATGALCQPVPVDQHGLDVTAMPANTSVRLAYVTPSHQFPLGGVLPIGRRHALLQWARQQDAWILEDDYDGEFRYGQSPIDALQSIDADGRVIYMGTFSKALSPQLRLGYLVLPAALITVFRKAKRLTDRHTPVLEQRALASMIADGSYERHIRRLRRAHEQRRATLLDAITQHLPAGVSVSGTAAGLHVVVWLPPLRAADEAALVLAARHQGVGVYPVSPLYATSTPPSRSTGLILGYAGMDEEQIRQGIRKLAPIVAQMAASAMPTKSALHDIADSQNR